MSSLVIIKNLIGALLISLIFWPHSQTVGGDFTPHPIYKPLKVIKQPVIKEQTLVESVQLASVEPVSTSSIQSPDYYVNWIIQHESGGNPNAVNSSSGACGLFQKLPCDVPLGDVQAQMADGLAYITARYGSAYNAYLFWQANGWY